VTEAGGDRRRRRSAPRVGLVLVVAVASLAAVFVARQVGGDEDRHEVPEGIRTIEPTALTSALAPGQEAAGAGATTVLEYSLPGAIDAEAAVVNVKATGAPAVSLHRCDAEPAEMPSLRGGSVDTLSGQLIVPIDDGAVCATVPAGSTVELEAVALLTAPQFEMVVPPVPLLGTPDAGQRLGGEPVEVDLGRTGVPVAPFGLVAVSVTVFGADADGVVSIRPCEATSGPQIEARSGVVSSRGVVVAVGESASLCASSTVPTEVVVEITGSFGPAMGRPFLEPARVADTRVGATTIDARLAGIGVRHEGSTLVVPVTERIGPHDGLAAVVVEVTAADPLDDGDLTVHGAGTTPAAFPKLQYERGRTKRVTAVVPIGPSGDLCVRTSGRTDVVVDLVGLLVRPAAGASTAASGATATSTPPAPGSLVCPQQEIFPEWRVVAMYGSPRTPRLGLLGEQDAAAAATRLAELAEPWRAGDRPVLPAFELIATLAIGDPGDDGLFRLRSELETVREYLDVARRHGYHLILDLQPGWSDFLTEAKYYEEFLREPDVHLALDPEWRTEPPNPPRGGVVGQTTAAEVDEVAEWLADLVDEEGLPEKLLVVHQFQPRMVVDREQLVEPPGIALTMHMDGFGTRAQKRHTWSELKVDEPWSNGLKLFLDEDIDMFRPDEVLSGAFEPIPDLITYQ
jgi:hypothetical protein